LKFLKVYRIRWLANGIIFNLLWACIRIFTLGGFALAAKQSDTIIFAYRPVFVALAVLEVISALFYEVMWQASFAQLHPFTLD